MAKSEAWLLMPLVKITNLQIFPQLYNDCPLGTQIFMGLLLVSPKRPHTIRNSYYHLNIHSHPLIQLTQNFDHILNCDQFLKPSPHWFESHKTKAQDCKIQLKAQYRPLQDKSLVRMSMGSLWLKANRAEVGLIDQMVWKLHNHGLGLTQLKKIDPMSIQIL